ncbi:ABC transporter ATP-binding protein [Tropicimonas sp. S265A]|uniref:ABC transporter ATP-binding protein n=1 Tax=Tropicimonas sp. S265A TaxID=3415134 RepID=UPI003C7AF30C
MSGLQVTDLSFAYGARKALDAVSFDIAPGAFCALLGPNGAGKSTLFGLLTRLFTAPAGEIFVAGQSLSETPRAALAQIGVVFQQNTLDLSLSVDRNLRYFAALHGLSGAEAGKRIDAALDQLDIRARRQERVRDLNGGHRRRTEIARALIHHPSVLLLDEPTVGLDAAARTGITDHVHALAAETGLTVLWATHLTDEVRDTDRLLILHRGRILEDGIAAEKRGAASLTDHFLGLTGAAV